MNLPRPYIKSTPILSDMAMYGSRSGMLPGYFSTIVNVESRKRCTNKLELINGLNSYKILRSEWQDGFLT